MKLFDLFKRIHDWWFREIAVIAPAYCDPCREQTAQEEGLEHLRAHGIVLGYFNPPASAIPDEVKARLRAEWERIGEAEPVIEPARGEQ